MAKGLTQEESTVDVLLGDDGVCADGAEPRPGNTTRGDASAPASPGGPVLRLGGVHPPS
jgi:hypothetical protein